MTAEVRSIRTARPGATPFILTVVLSVYTALEAMLIPALPQIRADLDASPQAVTWAFTGLLLVGAVATPVIGRLCDVADKRRVLIAVVAVVLVGIVVSATANSVGQLIAGQMIQGVGAGLQPLAIGLLNDTQPANRLKPAIGLIVGSTALAAAFGLLASGWIISALSFTWLFWIPLTVMFIALVVVCQIVPDCPAAGSGSIDWLGAVLLGSGLVALLLGLTVAPEHGWTSAPFLIRVAIAAVLLPLFVARELRTTHPLIDLRGLRNRPVVLTCVVAFVVGFGTFALYVVVPSLASLPKSTGYGLGADTATVGLLLLPLGVFALASSPLTPHAERILGTRGVMALSTALIVGSSLLLLLADGKAVALYLSSAVCGIGIGLSTTQSMNIVVSVVPADRTASVAGTAFVLRSVGATLGGQIGASVLASDPVPGTPIPSWDAYTTTFVISAAVGMIALVLSVALPRRLPTPVPA
ncbi:MFS transporter [Embleya hyalina]|uniref:MFS transporter n=1 Tax=Embleya hyalina TaxID=516124 RepID=A0A401YTG8_9ACTN|nr:MFS transporter [Embleya hyalina]GCD97872.1 MFS transporter [Embleya hyalina]